MDHLRQVGRIHLITDIQLHTLSLAHTHGTHVHSGYDFGYLMRVLTCLKMPDKEQNFFELLSVYFPKVYDVKYLMKSCKNLKGGLQEVADSLEVC